MSTCMLCICHVPCVLVWEGASVHTELRHQASEAGSPSPFCSLKEWDFLQILCLVQWPCRRLHHCVELLLGLWQPKTRATELCENAITHPAIPHTPNPVVGVHISAHHFATSIAIVLRKLRHGLVT